VVRIKLPCSSVAECNGILLVEIPLHYVEIPLHSATLEESCVLFSCHSTTKVIVVDAVAVAEQRYE
jgi:hypothetical protein